MAYPQDLYGTIRKIIREETTFLMHYLGEVVDDQDPSSRGRVKVKVPELGFLSDAQGMWCSPRSGYSVTPPTKGEWVEVYFQSGDRRKPVYLVGAGEVSGNVPGQYSDPKRHVVYQNPSTGDYIEYDSENKVLTVSVSGEVKIDMDKVTMGGGSESFVLGDTLSSYLSGLKSWMDSHVHPVPAAPGTSSAPAVPSPSVPEVKSSKIKGE